MPRLEFNTVAPLLNHILETAQIDITLKDMTINAEVSIPTLPMRHCKAVTITMRTIAEIESLFPLAERGYFKIHSMCAKGPKYLFRFNFLKRTGTIDAPNQYIQADFAAFMEMIPNSVLHAVY
jgi:hypothetical protein